MDTKELLRKVQQIEIRSKRKTNNNFLGEYHTSFKGRGMIFSEVRPYQYGDDVRNMDWNKTAHFNEPYVKIFEEERESTLILVVDISASQNFGTRKQVKKEIVAEVCATLAFSAMANNDKVGLLLYSGDVEFFLPPAKGRFHALRIIRELLEFQPQNTGTDLNKALEFLMRTQKRRAIVFIISDFDNKNYTKSLQIVSSKHDVTGIRIYDEKEKYMPNIGLVHMMDQETGQMRWINTSSKTVRKHYETYYRHIQEQFENSFTKAGAGIIQMQTQDDYIKALLNYFQSHSGK